MGKTTTLIIAPHADDEILGCGGYISKNADREDINVIVVSHREEVRSDNIRDIDERLDIVSSSDLTKQIERLYIKLQPQKVFIPFDGDINSDHAAVHKSCLIAFRKIQQIQPTELLIYEVPSSTTQGIKSFFANTYSVLNREDVQNKWDMLSIYKSEVREYPNPRSKIGLETYARFRGMECNREFAEAYISLYKIIE